MSLLESIRQYEEVFWINDRRVAEKIDIPEDVPTWAQILEARDRVKRYQWFFNPSSDLYSLSSFSKAMVPFVGGRMLGSWYLKMDHELELAGSVKARGSYYELLMYAEKLALAAGYQQIVNGVTVADLAAARSLFEMYRICVGSTGNLGLSVGLFAKKFGFQSTVYLSSEAAEWKVEMLRSQGVEVVITEGDYAVAVETARKDIGERSYFVDDERSSGLFTGYAIAALELKEQLEQEGKGNDPLFVSIPCGVGGAPGGIAYALRLAFKEQVHIFLAEPTHCPSMLLGLLTGSYEKNSVIDMGLDNQTIADGLACPNPSVLTCRLMEQVIDGIYTVEDKKMLFLLYALHEAEQIKIEPSATVGLALPIRLFYTESGFEYMVQKDLLSKAETFVHVSWSTGGANMPQEVFESFRKQGCKVEVVF